MNQPLTTEPITYRHWAADFAPKAAPALATSTVLILARIWNANGAQHSIGDASVMGVLAAGAAFAGNALARGENGEPVAAAVGFTAAGTFALAGVAAYTDALPLPLLLWAVATVLAYVLAYRHWRTDKREATAYERATIDRRETQHHVETIEIIRARAAVETAQAGGAYATALAAALTARAALPGYDPAVLASAGLPELPTANA
ncbi:hypothetical protein [Actinacidiphila bryophytorum]|uniref:Uncharacterized protein n=1 Tax=Actinacidiphila bryophytorum TaxID=1436133 RepID=A0A9W4H0H6_9ACTN|nr:hypothetical protein [Actinacidiphila bryophytorum]MBM9438733.1 hypothetical protein [Actinacidiphila bryophytorum]MBN6546019.1 hypothetical protein [Actinacidiphila bryophytorum]CAG7637680.1 conserved membrane hypothetical protein [Actinacidiphila bryophytorum]